MIEKTLAIIKPDAVAGGHALEIVKAITDAGLLIVRTLPATNVGEEFWEAFYEEHTGKPFYDELISHMSSGRCIFLELEGENAIQAWRGLMGATNPAKADPGTLRGRFGIRGPANAVHGSDSPESAARELAHVFNTHNEREPMTDSMAEKFVVSMNAWLKGQFKSENPPDEIERTAGIITVRFPDGTHADFTVPMAGRKQREIEA